MSKINQYNAAEKLAILQELGAGQGSRTDVAQKYDVSVNTLVKWRHRYELYGIEGLEIRPIITVILRSFKLFKIICPVGIHNTIMNEGLRFAIQAL